MLRRQFVAHLLQAIGWLEDLVILGQRLEVGSTIAVHASLDGFARLYEKSCLQPINPTRHLTRTSLVRNVALNPRLNSSASVAHAT